MKNYSDHSVEVTPGIMTGNSHLDNILSVDKGFQSAVVFMTGTSGSGKTTLSKLFQKKLSQTTTALYERETSAKSVAKQTRRVSIEHNNALIADDSDYKTFMDFMNEIRKRDIKFVIIDSLQTAAADYRALGFSKTDAPMQVLAELKKWKDETGGTAVLIGMVNKDGDFSGVNEIKHLADIHVHLTYDKVRNIRTLETTKNRDNSVSKLYYEFVDTDEVIVFYTEKEYELKGRNLQFEDYIYQMVQEFLGSVSKKHVNYKTFKSDYNQGIKKIGQGNTNKLETGILLIRLVDELSKKYSV